MAIKNITVTHDQPTKQIECPDGRYCRIIDGDGKESVGTCSRYATAYGQLTTLKCLIMKWGQMQESESKINLIMEGTIAKFMISILKFI